MRQVNDGLDPAFKEFDAQFIEQQGNQEGKGKVSDNFQHGNKYRIEKNGFAVVQLEQIDKVVQPHPGRPQYPLTRIEILKRYRQSEHWDDLEYEYPDQPGDKHQIIMLFE